MIDIINGFLKAINSVTEKVGISVPILQHISLQAAKLEAPKLKIPRWAETSFGQEIEARLAVPEPEEEVEEDALIMEELDEFGYAVDDDHSNLKNIEEEVPEYEEEE